MGYYTALNNTWTFIFENGTKVCDIMNKARKFVVYEHQGRYYLYRHQYQLSQIVDGERGFMKQYKGDYNKWIEKIEKKDKEKIIKLRKMAQEIINDAYEIENIWL